jgi:hypothetical protein
MRRLLLSAGAAVAFDGGTSRYILDLAKVAVGSQRACSPSDKETEQ